MRERGAVPSADSILTAALESILVTDANLDFPGPTIVYANPAFEQMTGWSCEEIIGLSPRLLQGPETDLSIFSGMREIVQNGGLWEGMAINYRKDGSTFFMEWSISAVFGEDNLPSHYVAVQRDVSQRVAADRKVAKLRIQAEQSERRRLNLSRYVSPRMAQTLADRDAPLGQVRRQDVAIVMIDIIGFTQLAETLPPERVIALLRSFYRRIAKIIFRHEGSIEHFAGDSLMAVFGVPESTGRDARAAILSAVETMAEIERWNAKRCSAGRQAIAVGISAHYGTSVLGDIGTKQSMSFTVIGDTVNVTSRMQEICRTIGEPVLASREIIERMLSERVPDGGSKIDFRTAGTHAVRGRSQPIEVLVPILGA